MAIGKEKVNRICVWLNDSSISELKEINEYIEHRKSQLRQAELKEIPDKRKWVKLGGTVPNLLKGQDAQDWVSEMRGDCNKSNHVKTN